MADGNSGTMGQSARGRGRPYIEHILGRGPAVELLPALSPLSLPGLPLLVDYMQWTPDKQLLSWENRALLPTPWSSQSSGLRCLVVVVREFNPGFRERRDKKAHLGTWLPG